MKNVDPLYYVDTGNIFDMNEPISRIMVKDSKAKPKKRLVFVADEIIPNVFSILPGSSEEHLAAAIADKRNG